MACRDFRPDWVGLLYDDEFPVAEREAAEAHLSACPDCRETLEQLAGSRQVLRESAPEIPATPRVVVLEPRRWVWRPSLGLAATLAGAALLAAVGFFVGARVGAPSPAVDTDSLLTRQELQQALDTQRAEFERRLTDLSSRPVAPREATRTASREETLTPRQLQQALGQLERRIETNRARDLEFLLGEISATEVRAGNWFHQTRDALNMVALQNDPRFTER